VYALPKAVDRGAVPISLREARKKFFTFIFQLSGLAHVAPLWFLLTAEYAEGDRAQSEGQQYPQAL